MGITIGINASINHPHLTEVIKTIITNNVGEQAFLTTILDQEKVSSEDITDYINKLTNPVVDEMVMVGIITNFDRISLVNQNKLLKTIEDNKTQVQVIIFEHPQKVLDTIKSRLVIYQLPNEIKQDDPFLKIFNPNLYYWLINNEKALPIYRQINKYALQGRFKEAWIIFKTKIVQIGLVDVEIMQTIMLQSLKEIEELDLFKKIQKYENKNHLSLNLSLLIDAMMCDIMLYYQQEYYA